MEQFSWNDSILKGKGGAFRRDIREGERPVENLNYTLYISTADREMGAESLAELLAECRDNNGRNGITGMLLYKAGTFMQILEGPRDAVNDLMERVQRDPRHHNLMVIDSNDLQARNFPDWTMGFLDMDRVDPDSPDYDAYFRSNVVLREFSDDALTAYKFIVRFNTWNPH